MKCVYWFVVFFNILANAVALIKFTNVQCKEFDKEFATFEKCQLKMIKRGVVSLNINMKLFERPVTNVTFNLALFKKSNGYHPFMYNVTIDFCKFMKNRKLYPYMEIYIGSLANFSNLNHLCPYDHDIIISNMVLKESMFQHLPLPSGNYMLKLKAAAYNKWRVEVKAFMTIDLSGVMGSNIDFSSF